jgi:hypothetical protein
LDAAEKGEAQVEARGGLRFLAAVDHIARDEADSADVRHPGFPRHGKGGLDGGIQRVES